jgi:mitochondrial enoyl-[acyl-carrier protein] reductase / trans-2-enoyl-CoA reductase
VNPADLNFIEGTYGRKPELPCVPGMEAAGVVDAAGPGVTGWEKGAPALPLRAGRCWAEYLLCRADELLPLPANCDPVQAAMLRVNPATAHGLLRAAGDLPPGSWVVQNTASSACGHCVIRLAKHRGLRVACLVRRPESAAECLALGADAALPDDAGAVPQLRALMADAPPRLALNAAGGDSALRLMDLLAPGGTLVTYGAMARQPLKVPNGFLIFKDITLRGYWMTRWLDTAPAEEVRAVYTELAALTAAGIIRQQVAAVYPLAEVRAAVTHAAQSGRGGKVLLAL